MNTQIVFVFRGFNLEMDMSDDDLGHLIQNKIEPMIREIIKSNTANESWIYEFETYSKANIQLPDHVRQVFDENNIEV